MYFLSKNELFAKSNHSYIGAKEEQHYFQITQIKPRKDFKNKIIEHKKTHPQPHPHPRTQTHTHFMHRKSIRCGNHIFTEVGGCLTHSLA